MVSPTKGYPLGRCPQVHMMMASQSAPQLDTGQGGTGSIETVLESEVEQEQGPPSRVDIEQIVLTAVSQARSEDHALIRALREQVNVLETPDIPRQPDFGDDALSLTSRARLYQSPLTGVGGNVRTAGSPLLTAYRSGNPDDFAAVASRLATIAADQICLLYTSPSPRDS